MPIECPIDIRPITAAEFDEIDKAVMACAYASQNRLGRLCDERVYENDLAERLRALGFANVHTQVPVTVTHQGFAKTYRLDLVVNQMVYELKTAAGFASEHDAQAIHYAVMLEIDRVKLLNFRSAKVMGRLKRAPLHAGRQRVIQVDATHWSSLSPRCEPLARHLQDLLTDWGAFLEARLYEEGLIHFCGGEASSISRIPLVRDDIPLGSHLVARHHEDIAFIVTAMTHDTGAYQSHLSRLLSLSSLRAFQWLNLNHTNLQLTTVLNSKP